MIGGAIGRAGLVERSGDREDGKGPPGSAIGIGGSHGIRGAHLPGIGAGGQAAEGHAGAGPGGDPGGRSQNNCPSC